MRLREILKKTYISFFIPVIIFFLDRISKFYVIHLNQINNNSEIFSSKFLNIQLMWNEGIAFGLFSFTQENLYNVLTIIILFIIFIILILAIKSDYLKKYSLLLILGGALGNVYDRIFYKAVPDFIDFHVENFHWFIFNVADIFITLGVIFMIIIEYTDSYRDKKI